MRAPDSGFTLIEIIIVLVVAAIAAAALTPFMGSALTRSNEPLEHLRDAMGLSSHMAVVVAEYRNNHSRSCEDLREWDIETIDSLDGLADHYEMPEIEKVLCRFDDTGNLDCEEIECDDECKNGICVLAVQLTSTLNSGVFVRYFFPVSIPEEDDDPDEPPINDPEGCLDWAGPNCKELAEGYVCIEFRGASGICRVWIQQ